jgi:biopolymer transport protein ExbB
MMFAVRRLLLATMLCWPALSLAWWDDQWNFRKPVTVDTTAAGAALPASVDRFTLLLRLDVAKFPYFADTKPDGADIRFIAADDKTPLPFHIESYDPVAGMAFIWVQVPRLTAGTTETFYMYYGNPDAVAASEAPASFDVSQVLVYHFEEGKVADRTSYGNNPAASNAVANPGAVIGSGIRFNGAESVSINASPSLRLVPAQGLTASMWVSIDQEQPDAVLLQATDAAGASLTLAIDGLTPYLRVSGGGRTAETPRTARLTPGTWHLLTAVISGEAILLYLDGARITETPASPVEIGGTFTIGADGAGQRLFVGRIDELVVANTARSADWVAAVFANQGQAEKLLRYGEDSAREASGGQSYLLITLQNVTVDGWVIIGMLTVMAMISWVIMISKGMTLRRVRRDNDAFIGKFRSQAARDVSSLDHAEEEDDADPFVAAMDEATEHEYRQFPSSTLYHLYHTGIREVKRRLAGAPAGADRSKALSREAMDAIRATLDAANVRETQRLNSQMVLLTLAIAGGPFLGLLGTVVGVMITFAAIAATGDVNINSIAPGIAAALVATVAGLAVAIPALFGYNWLASQIKETVADDRVFVDEFVTRLAEHYS